MTQAGDFGATGNGQTDDTEALQHAIDEGVGELLRGRTDFSIGSRFLAKRMTGGNQQGPNKGSEANRELQFHLHGSFFRKGEHVRARCFQRCPTLFIRKIVI